LTVTVVQRLYTLFTTQSLLEHSRNGSKNTDAYKIRDKYLLNTNMSEMCLMNAKIVN